MKTKTNTEKFNFSAKSPKGISTQWDSLGLIKRGKVKGGPFVSRLRQMTNNEEK